MRQIGMNIFRKTNMKLNLIVIAIALAAPWGVVFAEEPLTGDAFQLADQAYKAIEAGDLEKAAVAVGAALHMRSHHPQLLGILAQVNLLQEGKAYELADEAYKAVADGDLEKADKAAREALRLKPDHPNLLKLRAQVQIMRKEDEAAAKTIARALAINPGDAQALAMRGFLRLSQGNEDGARADFEKAMQTGELTKEEGGNVAMALADLYAKEGKYDKAVSVLEPFYKEGSDKIVSKRQSNLIYRGTLPQVDTLINSQEVKYALTTKAYEEFRAENYEREVQLFLAAESLGGLSAVQYGDAGYAARRSVFNEEAIRLFMAAIDAALAEPADKRSLKPRDIFGMRRAVDDLERDWGIVSSTTLSHGGATITSGSGQSGVFSGSVVPSVSGPSAFVQTSVEIWYQPPVIGYRDGRQFQIFAYTFETLNDNNQGPIGGQTSQGSIGVRWKPLRDYNLVFTAERLIRIGKRTNDDWLVRAGYSYDHGVDIKQYLNNWSYRTLFVETAYLVEQERSITNMEARWGHVFRFSTPKNLTFIPHLLFSWDYDAASLQKFNAGVGPGASLRWWFRENKYRAPASYVDLTIQYKFGLVAEATRQDGIFGRLTLWY